MNELARSYLRTPAFSSMVYGNKSETEMRQIVNGISFGKISLYRLSKMLYIACMRRGFFWRESHRLSRFSSRAAVTRSLAISHGADARTDREGAG